MRFRRVERFEAAREQGGSLLHGAAWLTLRGAIGEDPLASLKALAFRGR